jgi:phosphoglucosamine mutase
LRTARGRLFGTDGARGVANADLSPELALRIGRAFGGWLAERQAAPRVLLGRDTRLSGPMLAAAVTAGLESAGACVADCGVLPSPALFLLVRDRAAAGGVMVSASHNPPAFNGLKLVDGQGLKLATSEEHLLEERVFAEPDPAPRPSGEQVGGTEPAPETGARYLELLAAHLPAGLDLGGLRVALDCAWGAAYQVAPEAFRRWGARATALHAEPRGELINVDCGALHPEAVAREVRARGADLGIAFDGDADRAMFVDETGAVRDGDYLKYLLAADLQERGLLGPPLVAGTVMSNLGLEIALRERGIRLLRAPVGDRFVAEEMRRSGARLGGEQSGHLVFAPLGVGDGLYSAARVCEVLARTGRRLSELCAPVQKAPQVLINLRVRDKHAWEHSARLQAETLRWTERLADRGRILIRPSGTEPLVRVMVEALDADLTQAAAGALAAIVAEEWGGEEE